MNDKYVEVVRLRVKFAMEAFMEKRRKVMFLVQSAMAAFKENVLTLWGSERNPRWRP